MIRLYRKDQEEIESFESVSDNLKDAALAWRQHRAGSESTRFSHVYYEDTKTGEVIEVYPQLKTLSEKEILVIKLEANYYDC